MVSFAEACLFSALEGEAKFWITLQLRKQRFSEGRYIRQTSHCILGMFSAVHDALQKNQRHLTILFQILPQEIPRHFSTFSTVDVGKLSENFLENVEKQLEYFRIFSQDDLPQIFKARSAFSKQLCPLCVCVSVLCLSHFLFVWENLTSVSERYIFTNIF